MNWTDMHNTCVPFRPEQYKHLIKAHKHQMRGHMR